MSINALSATRRTDSGKGVARKLRAQNLIPAIAYGHGLDTSISLSLSPKALGKILAGPKGLNTLVELTIDEDAPRQVLVRQLQRHAVSRKVLHIDLVVPDPAKTLISAVPVNFSGRSVGVALGGRLRMPYREVKLESLPADIPASIEIDLTPLDIGEQWMASGLDLPEGVKVVYERDFIIAKCAKPRGKAEGEGQDEEEAAAPAES